MAAYWATSAGRVILMAAVGVSSATALPSRIQNPVVAIAPLDGGRDHGD